MSVRRFHKPRGKLNVGDKQETVISSRGMLKLRLHNRFIHVGVDISSYALLIGGRSSYPLVLVKLLYPRPLVYKWYWSVCVGYCVCMDYPRLWSSAVWDENNKVNVCTPSIPAGLKCPPPSKTISLITRLEVY